MSETAVEEVVSPDEFTPYEQQLADKITQAGQRPDSHLGEVALGLGAAFMLYRTYMRRRLREETRDYLPTPDALQELSTRIMRVYTNKWVATVVPALVVGYTIGLREAGTNRPSEAWIADSANAYARALGDNVHSVSTQALLEGVRAQINRRVATRVAIDRTIDAFGVTPRSMKAIVNMFMAPPPEKMTTDREAPNRLQDRVDARIARAITERAKTLGDTEAHLSKNTAKAMYWSFSAQMGQISPMAEKEWWTAKDERVCAVCGPMHRTRVKVNELFELPDGTKVVGPALHPNCRCDLRLALNEQASLDSYNTKDRFALAKSAWGVVHKARGDDAYDRDRSGRFSSTESRGARPAQARLRPVARQQFKEPEVDFADPRVSELLGQVEQMLVTSNKTSATDKVSATPRISAQQRISATPKVTARDKISAAPVETASVETHKITTGTISASNSKITNQKTKARLTERLKTSKIVPPVDDFDEDNFASESDIWINSPNGEPVYAVLGPDDWGDGDTVMTDEFTPFYAVAQGMSRQTLQQAVIDHWDGFLDADNIDYEFQATAHHEDSVGENVISYTQGDMRLHVPIDAYEVALVESVHGLTRRESEQVVIHAEQEGADGSWSYAEISVPAYDVAQNLGLHLLVSENTPVIARANKINATHYDEEAWGQMLTNPGKWKVLSSDIGSVSEWASRDQGIPLPYHMYDIDPLDLYPD